MVDFLDEDYRMLICGQSNCGKTNTLMHMIRMPMVYFDKIYFYAPNAHQEKIQDLIELMDEISSHKDVGYQVLEIGDQDDIIDTSEYPNDNRKVIFDDLVNVPDRVKKDGQSFYR